MGTIPFHVFIKVSKILKKLGKVGVALVISITTYLTARGIPPTIESVRRALRRQEQTA